MKTAIDYAKDSCEAMMRKFKGEELPPGPNKLHYHQGVFLSGMLNTYKVCGDRRYLEYVKAYVDHIVWENGEIHEFDKRELDDIQPGILFFDLYEDSKEEKYVTALNTLLDVLRKWPCNQCGGFWHKEHHPYQMWLDSLYMGSSLMAMYAKYFNEPHFLDVAVKQAIIMHEHLYKKETGLYYHAWDASKAIDWADKETGLSTECWGRAIGWYAVAVQDIMECMEKSHPQYEILREINANLLKALCKFQDDATGMWYQVVDKPDGAGNWLETSCSCLFTYAIARGVRMGIIDNSYMAVAEKGFSGVTSRMPYDGEDLLIDGVCVGTSVCTYDRYITRPTSVNDLHGVGAFLLMCAEMAR